MRSNARGVCLDCWSGLAREELTGENPETSEWGLRVEADQGKKCP